MLSKKEQEEIFDTLIANDMEALKMIGILTDQIKALAEEVKHLSTITDLLKLYITRMK
jgi:hypothetical protein